MRILLAPDSFKGTLSAEEICRIMEDAIRSIRPDAEILSIPMADGGEGMTAAYLKIIGGRRMELRVTGPLGAPVDAFYGMLPDGSAVIEMAAAAGLPLMGGLRDPLRATTRGVGEMLLHAAAHGARHILLGLGGSATNDMGCGMAAALGWKFLDENSQELEPLAMNLARTKTILPGSPFPLPVTAACDVQNPLLGAHGATAIYGPQKGVTKENHALLEGGLANIARLMNLQEIPGAGAAGGLGAGVLAFLQGRLVPGIDMLLDAANFDTLLQRADLVITGEGRMDAQSANGKVPMGVGLRCKDAGVLCIAVCGSLGDGAEEMRKHGVTSMYAAAKTGYAGAEDIRRTTLEAIRSQFPAPKK